MPVDFLSSCIIHNLEGINNVMQSWVLFAGVMCACSLSLLVGGTYMHSHTCAVYSVNLLPVPGWASREEKQKQAT